MAPELHDSHSSRPQEPADYSETPDVYAMGRPRPQKLIASARYLIRNQKALLDDKLTRLSQVQDYLNLSGSEIPPPEGHSPRLEFQSEFS